jgi:hypothetical protein
MSVSYQLQDKQIIISSIRVKEKAKNLVINQQREIKGVVSDSNGMSILVYRYCDVDESEHQQILMGTILSELKKETYYN